MPGYLTQLAEEQSLQLVTATSAPSGGQQPTPTTLRNFLLAIYNTQGLAGLTFLLPVSFMNFFATQAKADTSGSWLAGQINGRLDSAGTQYLALLTGDPGQGTTMPNMGTLEVTATGYSRQPVSFSQATLPASGGSGISNAAPVFFGPFTASGGLGAVVTHVALVSTATGTGGGVLAVWQLDNPVSASQNENVMLSTGGLAVGMDSWQT